jgi:hypothetical protein
MVRTSLLAGLILLVYPLTAAAQPAGDGKGGSEVELDEDPPPSDSESGAEEDPGAPRLDEPDTGPKAPSAKTLGYPIEEVKRPQTLPEFTSEVRLDLRMFPDPVDAEASFKFRFGVTRQIQVGVRYGIGGFYNDGKGADPKVRFNTGKAVAIDFQYLIQEWLAPRLSIPMYVDPFAIGVTLGPSLKFRLFDDKLALVG